MLHLTCTYLIVKDMEESISFYETVLGIKAQSRNIKRWAQFDCGNTIALWNPEYDLELIRNNDDLEEHFNKEYLLFKQNNKINYGNNIILNFNVPDLKNEYERIKALNIGRVTEILYINIVQPYYCFILEDPDGNMLEITGPYNK
ncbi:VOC family protein [Paenibacillus sp. 7124]|uniref:VOC family protein n=1 Tax=Paenibacillus apii TaxID=1850370 RepID=A0A6M1PMW3_9BACL|nr:VOC family protein [Paenibacillus apii]NGM83485.1 VOC family protein [Paenibacillus apii]NJJ39119.1 VOC family protein [Paenibacillus apii]